MTQPIQQLSAAGPYRQAGARSVQSPSGIWKYCNYFAVVLSVASFTLIGLLYSGAIAETAQEAYFFVLRSIGMVSGLASGMLSPF